MSTTKNTSNQSISKIKSFRKRIPSAAELIKGILAGNKTALSRAITLIESTNPQHIKKANIVVEACLSKKNESKRIGITGVPGVGKSTFIEVLGKMLIATGAKVAVLAVDPSSSITKGSILGDKTRMEDLVKEQNAFIRPSPSGDTLGGVAKKTRETIILCEAAGYDTIIIETVGVGQSETVVHSMVDFFLLLKIAGAGDELQGIKRGIIEMADSIVINKADGTNIKNVKKATIEFKRALQLYPPKENGWIPEVLGCSAIEQRGIDDVWNLINTYITNTKENGFFIKKRQDQNEKWLLQTIDEHLKLHFYQNKKVKKELSKKLKALANNETSPFIAAQQLLELLNS